MIKTLRITSIAAAVLACGFLAFPFIFGIHADPKVDELLKAADAVEKFSGIQNQRTAKKDTQLSPLVKQAQAFALYLNPPEPKPQPESEAPESSRAVRPVVVTPKFDLIGTSIHPTRPELSLALIDEPGKGMHWVKQSAKIEHLTIEQIKSGVVVVSDGARTSEIAAERPEKISLLRNPPAENTPPAPSAAPPQPTPESPPAAPQVEAPIEQISKELEEIERQVNTGTLDPNAAAERSAAVVEKYMADTQSARSQITSEEAKGLDKLGSQLQAKQDGNSTNADVLRHPEQARRVEGVKQPPQKPQVVPKTETKSTDAAKTKPVIRQRDPRRRTIRPRGGTPAAAPQSAKPTQQ